MMIEMADMAWNAIEHRCERKEFVIEEEEILHLKLENERLKEVLAENLAVLDKISQSCYPLFSASAHNVEALLDAMCPI
ncbi:uncharacterized protein A4U43_C02F16230 [Asparagus officinalis]|uniref:Uncharacterized protein n=1 Tax=Asparagus officinalis TaxID=4686 RepID=A0A5P1FNI8_ASPOF|nr:uncharacterized protein A4U43_C02F16230 [Asparagus officinalis]